MICSSNDGDDNGAEDQEAVVIRYRINSIAMLGLEIPLGKFMPSIPWKIPFRSLARTLLKRVQLRLHMTQK